MFQPPKHQPTYKASKKQRSLLARTTPVFWLAAVLGASLLCLILFVVSRSVFKDSYNPLAETKPAAALLPSPIPSTATVRPAATRRPPTVVLAWTSRMTALPNGRFAPPADVQQTMQTAWDNAMGMLDSLPWQSVDLTTAFTGPALQNGQALLQDQTQPASGELTQTVPQTRTFSVVGCDAAGSVCQVTETLQHLTLNTFDAASHQQGESVVLDQSLIYILRGTLTWQNGAWRVSDMQEPLSANQES